jgi:hypothetical protein
MAGTKTQSPVAANIHERVRDISEHTGKAVAKTTLNELNEGVTEAWRQILARGKKTEKAPTEKAPEPQKTSSGIEIIDLIVFNPNSSEKKGRSEKAPRIEAAMNYTGEMSRSSERATKSEMREMNQNIKEIQNELRQLLQSSKVLQMEFAEVAVEQAPVNVGQYHLNFFEWMLAVIKQARHKVEDSGAWLNTVKGKGGKKGKKGFDVTNQSMHQSGERTTIQNSAG